METQSGMEDQLPQFKSDPYTRKTEPGVGTYKSVAQDHGIDFVLDRTLIDHAAQAIENKQHYGYIPNQEYGSNDRGDAFQTKSANGGKGEGLPAGTIRYRFRGSAGQSFEHSVQTAFFILEGESNDYFGKGLSGATLVVSPDRKINLIRLPILLSATLHCMVLPPARYISKEWPVKDSVYGIQAQVQW